MIALVRVASIAVVNAGGILYAVSDV